MHQELATTSPRLAPTRTYQPDPRVDPERRAFVTPAGIKLRCSNQEWLLFERLALSPGHLVTKPSLYAALYARTDGGADPRIVDTLLCRLRKKCPFPIETVWGEGYILSGYALLSRSQPAPALASISRARLMAAR